MRIVAQADPQRDLAHTHRMALAGGLTALLVGVAAFGTARDSDQSIAAPPVIEPLAVKLPIRRRTRVRDLLARRALSSAATRSRPSSRASASTAPTRRRSSSRTPDRSRCRNSRPGTTVQRGVSDLRRAARLRFLAGDAIRCSASSATASASRRSTDDRAQLDPARLREERGDPHRSLFAAADEVGLPDSIAMQIADMFCGDIDFHRDLRGRPLHRGLRGALSRRAPGAGRARARRRVREQPARRFRAVWFADEEGRGGYYAPDGKNLRKAFLRSPLEFSRVTSGFGMRRHPILQDWRAAQGHRLRARRPARACARPATASSSTRVGRAATATS